MGFLSCWYSDFCYFTVAGAVLDYLFTNFPNFIRFSQFLIPIPLDKITRAITNNITIYVMIINSDKIKSVSTRSKKPYLNELTKYAIGLKAEISCQISGRASIG